MSDDDSSEKSHDPTQKRLDDARRKGEIARSVDLTTAAGYAGFMLAAMALGATSLTDLGGLLSGLLSQADRMAASMASGSGQVLSGQILIGVCVAMIPWVAGPAIMALLSILAQRGLVFAPSKIEPKLSRLSPIAGIKNKFGRAGLFEFAKSLAKLVLYAVVLGLYLGRKLPELMSSIYLDPGQLVVSLLRLVLGLLLIVLIIAVALGLLDLVFQRGEHMRRQMMTRKELLDEMKESDGDPALKQQRRQKAINFALNQMIADVADADVVIVNPTHYAVALKWSRQSRRAPVCVAKGVDEIAARIREAAAMNGIPLHSDPPTARALHASVEIGDEIRPDHYRAVAAAIRFAERIRQKARRQ